MALRDVLAGEDTDHRAAADAAAHGRSITGFSGRHTEIDERVARREGLFGDPMGKPAPQAKPAPDPEPPGPTLDVFAPLFGIPADAPGRLQRLEETRERVPFGDAEQQLAYAVRPGYRRYWFNDRPGRILRARQAGYEHVKDPETGEPVSRTTDVVEGRGRQSYLMEQPIHWYQADMAKNAQRLEAKLNDIRRGRAGPGAEDNRYIPQQGIRIEGR